MQFNKSPLLLKDKKLFFTLNFKKISTIHTLEFCRRILNNLGHNTNDDEFAQLFV